jgi:hypothetical protein
VVGQRVRGEPVPEGGRGRLHAAGRPGPAAGALLERFAGGAAARLVALLRFILPFSGDAAMHAA